MQRCALPSLKGLRNASKASLNVSDIAAASPELEHTTLSIPIEGQGAEHVTHRMRSHGDTHHRSDSLRHAQVRTSPCSQARAVMSTSLGGGGTRCAGGYTHGAFGPLGCSWTASGVLENRTVHQNKITQCVYRVTDRITRRSSDLEYRVHARHGSQETLTHAWAAANRQPNANFAQHAVPGRCFVIFVDSCGPHAHRIGHPRPATTPQLISFDNPHPCDVKKRLKHSHATDI